MQHQERLKLVREVLSELVGHRVPPAAIPDDCALFGAGLGLDSYLGLKLIVRLEERFGVTLDEEITVDEIQTVAAVASLIARAQEGGSRS